MGKKILQEMLKSIPKDKAPKTWKFGHLRLCAKGATLNHCVSTSWGCLWTSRVLLTKQRISTSWGVCRLLGWSRKAYSAALRLLASPRGIKLSLLICRSNSSVFPLHADLPEKSFVQRKKRRTPNVRLLCRIVDRSMDPNVPTVPSCPRVVSPCPH